MVGKLDNYVLNCFFFGFFYLLFQVAKSVQEDETLYTWSQGYFQLRKMKTA